MGPRSQNVQGKKETIPITTLSPPEWRLHYTTYKAGSDESHFNVLLIVKGKLKSQNGVHRQFLKRAGSRSGIEPRSFCLPALHALLTAGPNRPTLWIRLSPF